MKARRQFAECTSAAARCAGALLACTALSGCGRAPSFDILGSFFPAWLLCMVAGIVLAVVVNRILIWQNLDKEIVWSILVYPCIALFFACLLWLVFFS
jgi:hypothetical protein